MIVDSIVDTVKFGMFAFGIVLVIIVMIYHFGNFLTRILPIEIIQRLPAYNRHVRIDEDGLELDEENTPLSPPKFTQTTQRKFFAIGNEANQHNEDDPALMEFIQHKMPKRPAGD